jgi:Ca2+-binding EF-hand superfamily protein
MMVSLVNSGLYGQAGAQRLLSGLMAPSQASDGQISPTGDRLTTRFAHGTIPSPQDLPRLVANPRPLAPTMMAALLTATQDHEPTADEQAASLVEQADADGDGGLSNAEVRSAMHLDPAGPEADLQRIDTRFSELDADGDGRLDESDLTSALGDLGGNSDSTIHFRPDIARLLIHDSDTDGDGRVTCDEIVSRLSDMALDADALRPGLARWDVDRDGGLSVDELRGALS